MATRVVLKVFAAIGAIAGVVSFLMPVSTPTQWFLCLGSFALAFICFAALNIMNDKNASSWPDSSKTTTTSAGDSSAPADPLKR